MPTGLLERDRELSRIAAAIGATAGGAGGTLLVLGPSGIGKTSLLAAAREEAARAGLTVLRARGASLERDFAFGVARQVVEGALAAADPDAVLQGAARPAADQLGVLGAAPAEQDGAATPFAMLHGLYWVVSNLASARGPLLLVADDLHWADPASVRWLAFLAPRLLDLPVLLLAGLRPEAVAEDPVGLGALTIEPAVDLLDVGPLSADGVAAMLGVRLGRAVDEAFAAAVREATGGTPMLVRALAEALPDEPDATSDPWRLAEIGGRAASRWIRARLRDLGPPATRLAEAIAVLEVASPGEAAQLAGVDEPTGRDAADALAAAGILAPGVPLSFAHAMLRAAVYDGLGGAGRADGHRRAADLLTAAGAPEERVLEHLARREPSGDGEVVARLLAAARTAERRGAPESAVAYLRRALAEPPAPEQRPEVLLAMGVAATAAGDPVAFEVLERAMETASSSGQRVEAGLTLMHALGRAYRLAEAGAVIDRLRATLASADEAQRLSVEAALVIPTMLAVETAAMTDDRARALRERADAAPEPPREVLAVAAWRAAHAGEPRDVVAGLAERALAAGPLPEPRELPWLPIAVTSLIWSERYELPQRWLDDGLAQARAAGDALLFAEAMACRSLLHLRRDELSAAEADAEAALSGPWPLPELWQDFVRGQLLEVLVEQGRLGDADALAAALGDGPDRGSYYSAIQRSARGRLRLAQRRPEDALADLEVAGEVMTALGGANPALVPWRAHAAEALVLLGRQEEAAALAAEDVRLAEAFGAPRTLARALRIAGRLEDAERVARAAGARLELARVLAARGAALRRDKQRAAAREPLTEALALAGAVGAEGLAAEVETELDATGVRARRRERDGADALTASERRVVELARDGLTNPQIAQALFVTTRTVEGHLSAAFGKLGVSRRGELAGSLPDP